MAFKIESDRTCLFAVQTGTLDWQDCDQAFLRCEAVLMKRPRVNQLLLDLRQARLTLSTREASDLANLAALTFSRPIRTAIVCPEDTAAANFMEKYVQALKRSGAQVEAFESLGEAHAYLRPRCAANPRSVFARLQNTLQAVRGRTPRRQRA